MNSIRPAWLTVLVPASMCVIGAATLVCEQRPLDRKSQGATEKKVPFVTQRDTIHVDSPLFVITGAVTTAGSAIVVVPDSTTIIPPRDTTLRYPTPLGDLTVDYPEEVRRAGVQGTVKLLVYVDESGRAAKTEVHEGLHPTLDSAAMRAVRECLFQPMVEWGRPQAVWILFPVEFNLEDSPSQNP